MIPLTLRDGGLGPAVVELLAVAAGAVTLWLLARLPRRADRVLGELARTGVIVATAGALARPAWRITTALTDADLSVLAGAHLGLLAPGMVLLALAMLATTGVPAALRPARTLARLAVALLVLAVSFGIAQSGVPGLGVLLVVVASTATTALILQAARVARTRGRPEAQRGLIIALLLALVAASIGLLAGATAAWIEVVLQLTSAVVAARAAWLLAVRWTP